jgi:N-acetylglucosaminylphosphatidylinositol deacetylase
MMPLIFSSLILFISLLVACLYRPIVSENVFVTGRNGDRILLLTAHPDDECMFFAPTLQALAKVHGQPVEQHTFHHQKIFSSVTYKSPTTQVYSLCLSTGNADGLGETRRLELARSLDILGVESSNRWLIDHPFVSYSKVFKRTNSIYSKLQDNITSQWDPKIIAEVIMPYLLQHKFTVVCHAFNISFLFSPFSQILTFDFEGISSHPNHQSLPSGAAHLVKSLSQVNADPPPRLFTLVTVPLVSKYTGFLAPTLMKLDLLLPHRLKWLLIPFLRAFDATAGTPRIGALPVFVSGIPEFSTALRAMYAHQSQLVWFRWLYVLFSRYMWVNEWVELKA